MWPTRVRSIEYSNTGHAVNSHTTNARFCCSCSTYCDASLNHYGFASHCGKELVKYIVSLGMYVWRDARPRLKRDSGFSWFGASGILVRAIPLQLQRSTYQYDTKLCQYSIADWPSSSRGQWVTGSSSLRHQRTPRCPLKPLGAAPRGRAYACGVQRSTKVVRIISSARRQEQLQIMRRNMASKVAACGNTITKEDVALADVHFVWQVLKPLAPYAWLSSRS